MRDPPPLWERPPSMVSYNIHETSPFVTVTGNVTLRNGVVWPLMSETPQFFIKITRQLFTHKWTVFTQLCDNTLRSLSPYCILFSALFICVSIVCVHSTYWRAACIEKGCKTVHFDFHMNCSVSFLSLHISAGCCDVSQVHLCCTAVVLCLPLCPVSYLCNCVVWHLSHTHLLCAVLCDMPLLCVATLCSLCGVMWYSLSHACTHMLCHVVLIVLYCLSLMLWCTSHMLWRDVHLGRLVAHSPT